jgi:hypothetical protein
MPNSSPTRSLPRKVTDPITHSVVTVRDETDSDLNHAPPATSIDPGKNDARQSQEPITDDHHRSLNHKQALPPANETSHSLPRQQNAGTRETAFWPMLAAGFGFLLSQMMSSWSRWTKAAVMLLMAGAAIFMTRSGRNNVDDIPGFGQDQLPYRTNSNLQNNEEDSNALRVDEQVSVAWLNSVVSSLWPIVNPDVGETLMTRQCRTLIYLNKSFLCRFLTCWRMPCKHLYRSL